MKKIGIKLKFNMCKPMVKHKKSMNYESVLVKLRGNQLKGLGDRLGLMELYYNSTKHSRIRISPFELT
jgi:hypothetical protein